MTVAQMIKVLSRVPADSPVYIDVSPGRQGGRHAVEEVETEQLTADGPPNGLGGPTKVGTGVWVVTIRWRAPGPRGALDRLEAIESAAESWSTSEHATEDERRVAEHIRRGRG